jgi:hypothetical protein
MTLDLTETPLAMIEYRANELVIIIPSGSPEEDHLALAKALINCLKAQRTDNLPQNISEYNCTLLDLLENLVPCAPRVALARQNAV